MNCYGRQRPFAPISPLIALVAGIAGTTWIGGAAPVAGQTRYIAFGDSITFGVGEAGDPETIGYPPRLETLLNDAGQAAEVINQGLPGETTAEGISRIDEILADGGDVLLLMEGTNDVNARLSNETIQFNLDQLAVEAERAGLEVVHLTIVPRLPSANFDGSNRVAGALNGSIRDLAWENQRRLIDPFEIFLFHEDDPFGRLYGGGSDNLHPDGDGYEVLARTAAEVLTGVDSVPPVTGIVGPEDDAQNVPGTTEIQVDLFDFGGGIDVAQTRLLIDDQAVAANLTGDSRKLEIRYQPANPFTGVVFVGVESRDLASPVNILDRRLAQFVVAGTQFLDGDIDRDGRVDGLDLVQFAVRFGASRGQTRYRSFADLNGDDVIDGADLAILASNFGQTAF